MRKQIIFRVQKYAIDKPVGNKNPVKNQAFFQMFRDFNILNVTVFSILF